MGKNRKVSCVLAVTALIAFSAHFAQAQNDPQTQTVNGKLISISKVGMGARLSVDGRVLIDDHEAFIMNVKGAFSGGGHSYALIEKASGGEMCPATYQIIDLTDATLRVSPSFGNCSDRPKSSVVDGAMHVSVPQFRAGVPVNVSFRDGRFITDRK